MTISLRCSPVIPRPLRAARNRSVRLLAFNGSVQSSTDEDASLASDFCTIADVSYSNDTSDGLTRLEVVVRALHMRFALARCLGRAHAITRQTGSSVDLPGQVLAPAG